MNSRWVRVTKKDRCRVCGRPDWCTYSPDLGLALCMREESNRPSRNAMGGWLHKIGEAREMPRPVPAQEGPRPDFWHLWRKWFDATDPHHLDGFAMTLGVDTDALRSLGCAWTGKEWAFPMRAADRALIGIRLRDERGNKWAVKGSKQGLFIPDAGSREALYVVEGPTDTAAALTLGLHTIGRPSCMGAEETVKRYARIQGVGRVVIVTDNDAPGLRGAERLRAALQIPSCTYSPPCKDLREFVRLGGSRQLLESSIKDLVWQCPAA